MTFTGLIMCSVISFPLAAFISTNNSFTSYPHFNLKAFERELLYEIWPYRGSFIICPGAYDPIYSSSNSSCIKLQLYIAVRQYSSFGYNFVSWNQSAPPSASHLCTKLGVACWMSGHCCRSARDESQPWKLYSATLGCYLSHFYACTHPNPSPVACWLAFPSSSPPEPRLHISWKTSPPAVAKSIRHYWNFPKAAKSQKSPKNLQPPSPCAGVHLAAISDSSVLG